MDLEDMYKFQILGRVKIGFAALFIRKKSDSYEKEALFMHKKEATISTLLIAASNLKWVS